MTRPLLLRGDLFSRGLYAGFRIRGISDIRGFRSGVVDGWRGPWFYGGGTMFIRFNY